MLEDREGFEQALPVPAIEAGIAAWQELLEGARIRAERALARPVTHAVIVLAGEPGRRCRSALAAGRRSGGACGVASLRADELTAGPAPALAAAILAEELAPRPEFAWRAGPLLMPKMIFIESNGTRREVDAPLGASVLKSPAATTSTSKGPAKARSPARPAM